MANTTISPSPGALGFTGSAPAGVGFYMSQVQVGGRRAGYRTDATFQEQLVHAGPCRLYGIYPEPATLAAAVTLRSAGRTGTAPGSTPRHVCAAALTQNGKTFPMGVDFPDGLTVQLANVADLTLLVWESLP